MNVPPNISFDKKIRAWFLEPGSFLSEHSLSLDSYKMEEQELLLVINSPPLTPDEQKNIVEFVQSNLCSWDEVGKIKTIFTSKKNSSTSNVKPPPDLKIGRHPKTENKSLRPMHVDKIIAIASGKGGVGKSTFVSNIAFELKKRDLQVGIIDADMHGPSQPTLLNCYDRPKIDPKTKKISPSVSYGIKFISIGLLVPENQAVIWRGPMLMGALEQFLKDVNWGKLDFLIIDLPPGTGDVQLTLSQKADIDGSIIISTPQDVALIDARKAIQMFERLKVKIFGLVENMSTHICSKCGHEENIFGKAGVKMEAETLGLPLLGEIPLDKQIREDSDNGIPFINANPSIEASKSFSKIVDSLLEKIKK